MTLTDEQFKYNHKHNESFTGEKNDCSVRMFAYAFDTSYEFAHKWMEESGRKQGSGVNLFKALYSAKMIDKIKLELGYNLTEVVFRWNETYRRKPTLKKLLTELNNQLYIVITCDHTFVIDNNRAVDSFKNRPGVRAHRVFKVEKI